MKEVAMVKLDHNTNHIDSDACCKNSCRMDLKPSSNHNDGEAYYKMGQWLLNGARNNVDV